MYIKRNSATTLRPQLPESDPYASISVQDPFSPHSAGYVPTFIYTSPRGRPAEGLERYLLLYHIYKYTDLVIHTRVVTLRGSELKNCGATIDI